MKKRLIMIVGILMFALIAPAVTPVTGNTITTVQAKKKKKTKTPKLIKKYLNLWKYSGESKKKIKKYMGILGKKIENRTDATENLHESYIQSCIVSQHKYYVLICFYNGEMMEPYSDYDRPGDFNDYISGLGFHSLDEVDVFEGL